MTHGRKIATILALGTIGAFVGMTAASAGGGGHCEPTESGGTRVELSGACFTPTTLFVDPGQTIAFVNRDPIAHNVSGSGWGHYEDMMSATATRRRSPTKVCTPTPARCTPA